VSVSRDRLESGIRRAATTADLDGGLCIRLCDALGDLPLDSRVGIFRVPPQVAQNYGHDPGWWGGSVLAGIKYLETLLVRYDRMDRAVAVYLCGEERFKELVGSVQGDWRRALPADVQAALNKVLNEREEG
jgi:hypothetical protein